MSDDNLKDITAKLEELERRIATLEGIADKSVQVQAKKLSVKEFLLAKKPNDDVQKTLVIGRYLEQYELMTSFNTRDLAEGFRSAKEPLPSNINDRVNANITKGFMMETKEKKDKLKAWVLTNSGEKFVEEELPQVNKV